MDLALFGYLLFVLPGFCLVRTFRHYTQALRGVNANESRMGDFEYAAWSFLYGTLMFLFAFLVGGINSSVILDLNYPFELFSTALGMGLGVAIGASFPLGWLGAAIAHKGVFSWVDSFLLKLLKKF